MANLNTAESTPDAHTEVPSGTFEHFSPEHREDNTGKEEQELFLKAMALGIDPATVDPERLRELVHVNP